ncbi:WD40 repeat-containing protein, putative [Bodo saltans]|uniref:WD40 repeat-containing protein, putative n=1 Tax=Bodo saltans TaxID=75058 RepID=A0A0S4IM90_BODSA|nr:WD40 repeat-containing protein, putative [Bodo saltans]|eukprot:CUE72362.1 WD40 repeat-containing protein, putative [Bodo saltans]
MLFVSSQSPEGKTVLMDTETGSVHRMYKSDPSSFIHAPTFNPLQNALMLPQDKACLFTYSPTMQQPLQKSFSTERISASCVSPCGTILVAGSSETGCMYVWNVVTGELLRLVKAHLRQVTCLSFASDGSTFASASLDSTCRVWSVGSLVSSTTASSISDVTFTAHTLGVTACAFLHFSPVVATASADRSIKMFDSRTGVQMLSVTVDYPLTTLAVSPDDATLAVGGQQGYLYFVALTPNREEESINASNTSNVRALSYPISRDASWTPDIRRRPPVEGGHAKNIVFLGFPDAPHQREVIVGSENGVILLWNIDSLRVVRQIASIKKGICNVAIANGAVGYRLNRAVAKLPILSKYPVDTLTGVGYHIPIVSQANEEASSTAADPSSILNENAKYNKAKQKRQREERERQAAAAVAKGQEEIEAARRHAAAVEQLKSKTRSLEEMADKLREKLQALESRKQSKNSSKR